MTTDSNRCAAVNDDAHPFLPPRLPPFPQMRGHVVESRRLLGIAPSRLSGITCGHCEWRQKSPGSELARHYGDIPLDAISRRVGLGSPPIRTMAAIVSAHELPIAAVFLTAKLRTLVGGLGLAAPG